MTYKTEFPDYPAADMPALPEGFIDNSWHNNSAPSYESRALGLNIWIDYADPKMHEIQSGKRFQVYPIEAKFGGFLADDPILETDSWDDVLALIHRR